LFFDLSPFPFDYAGIKRPALIGFMVSKHARRWAAASKEQRRNIIAQQFAKAFDDPRALDFVE
jgi:monoamine oxidase